MTVKSFRQILHRSPGPYVVKLSSGERFTIQHVDFVGLPGPRAGAEDHEPLVVIYQPKGIEFLNLAQAISVTIPSEPKRGPAK